MLPAELGRKYSFHAFESGDGRERQINRTGEVTREDTYVKSIIRAAASVALHFPVMDESFNAEAQRAYSF